MQGGARVFSPRRQVTKVGVGFPSARVRARVDAYTGPGLCSRFLIEQRYWKQQSCTGAGAQLSSAALRSPASPALRLQPAAQIGELCNVRCSLSWPSGSMEAQKYANLAELEKCCQTHIFLQNIVLIQLRTSRRKICKILQFFPKR